MIINWASGLDPARRPIQTPPPDGSAVFQALDARTGKLLWMSRLGSQIVNGPITYEVDGEQYVTTIAGLNLVTFGLRR